MNANTTAVLVRRAQTGKDSYNNPVYGESYETYPAIYWPGTSAEATGGQDQISWRTTVLLPAAADVATAIDAVIPQAMTDPAGRLILDEYGQPQGDRFEVVGKPQVWPPTPWGWRSEFPVQVELERTVG